MEPGGKGGRPWLRRGGGKGSCTGRREERGRLQIAPEMDTSQVFISDSTEPQDDKVLDVDDWFDGSVTTLGSVLLPDNTCRSVEVSEGFRDWIFRG